jgi:hypothetical protein
VTTPGGSTTTAFTVTTPSFSITSLSQTSAVRGNGSGGSRDVALTITGTGLTGSTAVTLTPASGAAISCSAVNPVSDTSVTATCTLQSNTATGAGNVTVTTPLGTTNALTFTVNAGTPTLTSVAPNSVVRGSGAFNANATYKMTFTGTYLTGATAATFQTCTGAACATPACTNVTVASDNSVTATCAFTAAANTGARTVTVTTPGGTTGTQSVTVSATATVSPSPLTIPRNPSSVQVTISAAGGLAGATAVTLYDTTAGIQTTATTSVSCTIVPGSSNDTTLVANCSDTAAAVAATKGFRVTLGGTNNSGTVITGTLSVTKQ